MRGIILLWEDDTALSSLTQLRPLALLPLANRNLLEYQVDFLANCGLKDLTLITRRGPEQGLEEGLERILAGREGLKLTMMAGEPESLVERLEPVLLSGPVVLVAGPLLTDLDLSQALAFHRERKSSATVFLRPVLQNPQQRLVLTDDQGRVTRVLPPIPVGGKMGRTVENLFVLENSAADYVKELFFADEREGGLCTRLLEAGVPVFGFSVEAYWRQVRNPYSYFQGNLDILHQRAKLRPLGREAAPGIWLGRGVEISADVKLNPPVILGDGVELRAGVTVGEAVLGAGTCVDTQTVVSRSLVLEDCYLGKKVKLRGAVLGEETIVAKGAVLGEGTLLAPQSIVSRESLLGEAFTCL